MATPAQIEANRENAKHSSGPTSDAGKQASSFNNRRHGLTGHTFFFMDCENPEEFDALRKALKDEHKPTTVTEHIFVDKMAQQYWMSQRAQMLQTTMLNDNEVFEEEVQRQVSTFLRYQIQHDRLFQRAFHDLLKLRAEKRKEQIGFESQKRVQAQETRREAVEIRKIEHHYLTTAILKSKLNQIPNVSEGSVPTSEPPKLEKMAA